MKVAIMQPYFLPYIGYFQLIYAADVFVIYDNIEYTKKGWINRNRILVNGKDEYITLPLKKDSDFLQIKDRQLADGIEDEKKKMLRKIKEVYRKAPFFNAVYQNIETIFSFQNTNLFEFIFHSISQIVSLLGINTKIIVSSTLHVNHDLKGQEKVMAICQNLNANIYINPIGGIEIYSNSFFSNNNMELLFLKPELKSYPQFNNAFVPWLSILDLLMFNSIEDIYKEFITSYTLIQNNKHEI